MNRKKNVSKKAPPRNGTAAPPLVAALDIGSSKICCFIAELKSHGTLDVVGIGHQAARGVKSGAITDLKAVETAIAHAVESAEVMAKTELQGRPIRTIIVNAPATQTTAHALSVQVHIAGHAVTERDVHAALAQGTGAAVPGKDETLHIIPAQFAIDSARGIEQPVGMAGETLHVDMTAITARKPALTNITAALAQNHLEPEYFCSGAYAAGLAVLSEDEMRLGAAVIDMGGGTTSVAVFAGGKLLYTAAVPVGGIHVTNDIARGLTTSLADAERIKTLYGSAQTALGDDTATIDVPPVGEDSDAEPHYVPRSLLTGIIQPRIEETFELIRAKLVDSGAHAVAGRRVVLTGGAAQLPGLADIGQLILDKQIRIGRPQRLRGLAEATGGPAFATAAGLLLYAAEHVHETPAQRRSSNFSAHLPFDLPFVHKVTDWLKENW